MTDHVKRAVLTIHTLIKNTSLDEVDLPTVVPTLPTAAFPYNPPQVKSS
jgi:hypothetical protein